MSLESYLRQNPDPDEHEIREALAGNICRCTGIVEAVSWPPSACEKVPDQGRSALS